MEGKTKTTEIIAILDMSGSMHPLQSDTIGGYNSLIDEQKKVEGDAFVTTVLFDDRYIVLHDKVNIKEVNPLTEKEYSPCGMTALLDAVGKTFSAARQRIANLPEDERPDSVVATIITDGYENASREFSWDSVKKLIEDLRKENWVISFIGADIDTMSVGRNLGVDPRLSKSYTKSSVGTSSVYSAMSKSISKMRKSEYVSADEAIADIQEDMDEIQ